MLVGSLNIFMYRQTQGVRLGIAFPQLNFDGYITVASFSLNGDERMRKEGL